MFEDYLVDAFYFASQAKRDKTNEERLLRVATFTAASALEAFLNYVADGFENTELVEPYELALLQDKRFALISGKFKITEQTEFHRVEDKLKFLLRRFAPTFDIASNRAWSDFLAFKTLRDEITHPREGADIGVGRLRSELPSGVAAIIDLINVLFLGIYGKKLRAGVLELKLEDF